MKSKLEPATNRIQRILEILSSYTFIFYYLKDKDLILNDLLSRMERDMSDLYEVIPIAFNSHCILTGHYYTFFKLPPRVERVVTRFHTEEIERQMPKLHGADNVVNPALNPVTQDRREGILKSKPIICKSVSLP